MQVGSQLSEHSQKISNNLNDLTNKIKTEASKYMKKQKHGFWVFIFSLIPGAGEMYMGFKKQGLSIMLLFWGSIALASITGLGWLAMFLPVIWFYSFFNVHNLKSLSEEEFYSVEDNYILHMDQFSGEQGFLAHHANVVAAIFKVVMSFVYG